MQSREQLVNHLILRAVGLLYVPYIWGGNDPAKDEGLDCSGFIGYLLRDIGLLPEGFDTTADGYYKKYGDSTADPKPGNLVFYGKEHRPVSHIMLVLTPTVCVGGVRGNKWIDTVDKARAKNARIDIRYIDYRSDLKGFGDPFAEPFSVG